MMELGLNLCLPNFEWLLQKEELKFLELLGENLSLKLMEFRLRKFLYSNNHWQRDLDELLMQKSCLKILAHWVN